jgi:hypothetical protein
MSVLPIRATAWITRHLSISVWVPQELSWFWTLSPITLSQCWTIGHTGMVSISNPLFPIHQKWINIIQGPVGQSIGMSPQNLQTLEFTKTIKPKWLILYCKIIWPQNKLNSNNHWSKQGTFYFQIHHNLRTFQCYGTWSEFFWYPGLCSSMVQSLHFFVLLLNKNTLPYPHFSVFHWKPLSLTSTHLYVILSSFLVSQDIKGDWLWNVSL